MEEKIWVKELLDDVRRDAIRKSLGKKATEQVYSAIIEMVKLTQIARKEGIESAETKHYYKKCFRGKIKSGNGICYKTSMQKLSSDDDGGIAIVLRGVSKTYKEKLLSCMPSIRRNAVLETEAYMGPIRTVDIENAMVKFLECLEETIEGGYDADRTC